ncbi:MAG TPA: tetratricopeptide repeat protein [Sphingobium sp.]|nr:tetratricopeptide repeat protein [Sphingobium sp.]
MMKRAVAVALMVATAACSSTGRDIAIRPLNGDAGQAQDAIARGNLLFSRGEHALALDAFRRAVRKDPDDAHALNGVAISYAAIGRHDLAREYFELALARAPRDERIYRNFARSLTAQGRRGEADTLLAQMSGAAPVPMRRPTLAQLAGVGANVAQGRVPLATARLERLSMGEVRLRTGGATFPGQMTSQLSTAIVTVSDAGDTVPVALSRELKAPIARPDAPLPATASAASPARTVALPRAKPKAESAETDCAGTKGARLRATGYTIDLVTAQPGARLTGTCPGLAGIESGDGLFRTLWKWSGRLG